MDSAQQHALHWAFFVDVMDMPFDDIFDMFLAWRENLPEDKMADIMARADGASNSGSNGNTVDLPSSLYTVKEGWKDSSSGFSLN